MYYLNRLIVCLLILFILSSAKVFASDGFKDISNSLQPIPSAYRAQGQPLSIDELIAHPHVEGELLVKFRDTASDSVMKFAHDNIGATSLTRFRILTSLHRVKLAHGISVRQAIESYRKNPNVLYAEPNYTVKTQATPNDPLYGLLWGLHNAGQDGGTPRADISASQAWDITTGRKEVIVVVIDSGIDYNHPDLASNMWQNTADCNNNGIDDDGNGYIDDCYGIDTVNNDGDPMDDHSHGTHVAGIIGAAGNNENGIVGVNWNTSIIACKFLDYSGSGNLADAIECLTYAAMMKDRGENIIVTNNSWGGNGFSQALADAIDTHKRRGILFITAAGNSGADSDLNPTYPSGYFLPNILSVASSDRHDMLASFSNTGRRTVHVGAPGVEILSTTPENTYSTMSGTSMAAPHVTGVVALLKAQHLENDWRTIKNLILTGGDSLISLRQTVSQKRLNAFGSMTCSNSPVFARLQPTINALNAYLGTSIILSVLHINCEVPNGEVTVIINPGGYALTLKDNGVTPDQEAGDGIYTAEWTPTSEGIFTLAFPSNDLVAVRVISDQTPWLYRSYVKYPIGSVPQGVAIGDVNGDGKNDVVVTTTSINQDPENDNHIHIFLQNSSGTLDPPVKYPVDYHFWYHPRSVAIGDINNDGRLDVIIDVEDAIGVFYQNAFGGLDPLVKWPSSHSSYIGIGPYKVLVGDFNGDGLVDVASIGWDNQLYWVEVFLQNIDGFLNPSNSYIMLAGLGADLQRGDINLDGLHDIIVNHPSGGFGVLLQNNNGTFEPAVYYGIGMTSGGEIAVGDIDGDGLEDIVQTYGGNRLGSDPPFIGVFLQNQQGGFDQVISYPSYETPGSPQIVDVNQDGRKDLVLIHRGWLHMAVSLQAPGGGLFPYDLYPIPYVSGYGSMAAGDLNGDGLIDIAIADWDDTPGLVVLYNDLRPRVPSRMITAVPMGLGDGRIISYPPGIDCEVQCSASFSYGAPVLLIAEPEKESTFGGWVWFPMLHPGCIVSPLGECTIYMTENWEIYALFDNPRPRLAVRISGDGEGAVSSNPSGINCNPDCEERYPLGSQVTLTASPAIGSVFSGWGNECGGYDPVCTIYMNGKYTVDAVFSSTGFAQRYELIISKAKKNHGDGVVMSNDGTINCGEACRQSFYENSLVTLSATANQGSTFMGWKPASINCTGIEPCTAKMDHTKKVQAVFVGDYRLKVVNQSKKGGAGIVTSNPSGISCSTGSKVGCEATYPYAEQVTLSASADSGSTFLGWTPKKLCPGIGECVVSMDKKRSVKAVFLGE